MEERAFDDAVVLVVDDDRATARVVEMTLQGEGYTSVTAFSDPFEALAAVEELSPDIALVDLRMPGLDGFGLIEQLRSLVDPEQYFPIVVLTGDDSEDVKARALSSGAKDFLTKPFKPTELLLRVHNLLETRTLYAELRKHNRLLEQRVSERTEGLWKAVVQLEEAQRDLRLAQEETVYRLSVAAEFRDNETAQHVSRMSRYCGLLAKLAGRDQQQAELVRVASALHDVGKIGIPDSILLKPGRLTDEERAIMETHADMGSLILGDSRSELLRLAATIARTHHEKVDGTGYPRGLMGDDIPLEGRIAAICDVFDALLTDRVYRKAIHLPEVLEMMEEGRGKHFDRELLDAFLGSLDQVLSIAHSVE